MSTAVEEHRVTNIIAKQLIGVLQAYKISKGILLDYFKISQLVQGNAHHRLGASGQHPDLDGTPMTGLLENHGAPTLCQGSHDRPRVTIALFAYNQERHLRAAVEGALLQEYDGPLEIILSDDCSPDETFVLMQEVARSYRGPHHVRLNRNDTNLGLSAHVNRVLAMAQGDIIVMAAGDDISLPERVSNTVAAFARHPDAMAVSFEDIRIDDNGARLDDKPPSGEERIIDLETFLAAGPRAQNLLRLSAASRAFHREVYERFGDLLPDCPAEDSPYLLRALYLGKLVVCGKPGIRYRVHEGQMSSERSIAGLEPALFMAQYREDLDRALAENLVISGSASAVTAYFFERETNFRMRKLIYNRQVPDRHTVLRVLRSPFYTRREKLGLCKRLLLRQVTS